MGREPQLTDVELRVVRGMIDEYQRDRAVGAWFTARWKAAVVAAGALASLAVTAAAIVDLVRVAW